MKSWLKIIIVLNLAISLLVLGLLIRCFVKKEGKDNKREIDFHLARAGLYESNGLWSLAVREYQRAGELSRGENAFSIWMKAGEICYEELKDYQCAVENYFSARASAPEIILSPESASRLVSALKNIGREKEAIALLDELTALKPKPKAGSKVVAKIGEQEITKADLETALSSEPEAIRKSFQGGDGLKRYLEHYLFSWLLYQSALEEGMVDKNASQELEALRRNYLAELYYQKKILSEIEITDKELRGYYETHKEEFKGADEGDKEFEEVKEEISQRLKAKEAKARQEQWLKKQMEKRRIIIYEQAFGE